MPVDENKNQLRSFLAGKTTEELEELLALDFAEENGDNSNVDFIMTIMEVIQEREEGEREESQEDLDAAWQDFKEYRDLRLAYESETGMNENSVNDHECKSAVESQPRKKRPRILRYCIIAAIIVVLMSAPALASKWSILDAIGAWSKETFHFLIPNQEQPPQDDDPFFALRSAVARKSDAPAIPKWAPGGSEECGEVSVVERPGKTRIQGRFNVGQEEFTIRIIVHETPPDSLTGTYQKDDMLDHAFVAGGISHSLVDNYDNVSAMWINGYLEGYIQGNISLEDLQKMIESIYWE